jgi:hypothetical protein
VINPRKTRWVRYLARNGGGFGTRDSYRILVGRLDGMRPLGRPKVDSRVILKWVFMDWIDLAQDRDRWRAVVNAVMNLQVP